MSPKGSLLVAGLRPSFRQWAFFSSATVADPNLALWFGQGRSSWQAGFAALEAVKNSAAWQSNAWYLSPGDVAQIRASHPAAVVLETFRDYESGNAKGSRRFYPFESGSGNGGAVGGMVVFAEVLGDAQALKEAAPLLRLLAGSGFQKDVQTETHWLAANLEAPGLDEASSAAQYLVRQARAFFPLTDRLPDPPIGGNLFSEIQLAIDRAPRK
jgi:hypothetical protein